MKSFKELLVEAEEPKPTKLGHLSHLHRLMNIFPKEQNTEEEKSYGGHNGVGTSDDFLEKFHDFLRGKGAPNKYTFSEKMEGAPSFLVRKYGGVTSVAYKGAAGKPDKMLSSDEEIENAYGHAPGLVKKLKEVRAHAGKVLPDSQAIYQGDHMGSPEEIKDEGSHWSTQPNLVRTHFDKNEVPPTAKLMMSLHTMYDRGGARPIDRKTRETFNSHPDVLNIDPTINVNPSNYTPEEQAAFANHMENARKAYEKIKPEHEDFFRRHGDDIETFINRTIREGNDPSHDNYLAHLNERSAARVAKLKSEKGRAGESLKHSERIRDAVQNKKAFESAMEMMAHHKAAGEVLRKVAAKNSPHLTSINGEASDPEGVVLSKRNRDGTTTMAKVVNPKFTETNLRGGGYISQAKAAATQSVNESLGATTSSKHYPIHSAFRKSVHIEPRSGSKQIPVRSSVGAARNQHQQYAALTKNKIRVTEEVSRAVVATYNKGRIPHIGYNVVFDKMKEIAKQNNADHEVALSGASNPLPFDKKIQHAKKLFPGVNITSERHPSFLQHLSDLHSRGYKEVHYVVGSDRVNEFRNTIERYNGKPDKSGKVLFNFDKVHVHQAGEEREEGSEGVAGSSSSMQEKHAKAGDYKSFAANAPRGAKPA